MIKWIIALCILAGGTWWYLSEGEATEERGMDESLL